MPILKSNRLFYIFASFLIVSLFLSAGFISLAVILFFVYCCLRSNWRVSRSKGILFFPVVLFVLFLIGMLFTPDISSAGKIIVRKLPLLLFPACFLLLDEKEFENKDRLLAVFLAACVICSIVCYGNSIINIITHHSLKVARNDRPGDDYYYSYRELAAPSGTDPIYLSVYFNFALVIALHMNLMRSSALRWTVVGYLIVFILLLASKIGIVILGCVFVVWIISSITNKKLTYVLIAGFISLMVLGVSQLKFLNERFDHSTEFEFGNLNPEHWTSSTLRLAIWSCAIETAGKKPLMGYGTAAGQAALERTYREKGFLRGQADAYNAHNEFLSTILDVGIAGGILLAAMMGVSVYAAIRAKEFVTIGFLLGIGLCFLIETVLLRQKGIVFFSFFYSFLFWRIKSPTPQQHAV